MMDEDIVALVDAAREARKNAYAPYSHYLVGAAVLTKDGRIFQGANVENASFPVGLCAERVALFSAVAAGARSFRVVALVTADGGSPCGACRQAIAEFGSDIRILAIDHTGRIHLDTNIADLLPHSFRLDAKDPGSG
jgi:cytidine deaminase